MRTREDSQRDQQSLALSQSPDPMSDADSPSDEVDALGKHKELYTLLLRDFNQISKAEKRHYDSLAVVNVSPSVVPNPYLPSFRIFVYNATGAAYVPGDIGHGQGVGGRAGTSIDLGTYY